MAPGQFESCTVHHTSKSRNHYGSGIFLFFAHFLFVSNVLVTESTSVCASMCVYMFAVVE